MPHAVFRGTGHFGDWPVVEHPFAGAAFIPHDRNMHGGRFDFRAKLLRPSAELLQILQLFFGWYRFGGIPVALTFQVLGKAFRRSDCSPHFCGGRFVRAHTFQVLGVGEALAGSTKETFAFSEQKAQLIQFRWGRPPTRPGECTTSSRRRSFRGSLWAILPCQSASARACPSKLSAPSDRVFPSGTAPAGQQIIRGGGQKRRQENFSGRFRCSAFFPVQLQFSPSP